MAKKEKITVTTFAHNWGVIIPCKSGVVWQQQTDGVCCHQAFIEGVFVPLEKPTGDFNQDLLKNLQQLNYKYKSTQRVWEEIKKAMHFDFEDADEPKGQPPTQEGIRWIKLTKFESGWWHGDDVKKLIGKTVALIYPNCD